MNGFQPDAGSGFQRSSKIRFYAGGRSHCNDVSKERRRYLARKILCSDETPLPRDELFGLNGNSTRRYSLRRWSLIVPLFSIVDATLYPCVKTGLGCDSGGNATREFHALCVKFTQRLYPPHHSLTVILLEMRPSGIIHSSPATFRDRGSQILPNWIYFRVKEPGPLWRGCFLAENSYSQDLWKSLCACLGSCSEP